MKQRELTVDRNKVYYIHMNMAVSENVFKLPGLGIFEEFF
jgi:hypothetical protein